MKEEKEWRREGMEKRKQDQFGMIWGEKEEGIRGHEGQLDIEPGN